MGAPISVVIAAKNSADTIAQQLDALTGQLWPDGGEIIVADNGSTDDTAAIAASFDRPDRRVIILPCAEEPGAGYARNRGVEHARHERIGFCDADDIVGGLWVTRLGRALDRADVVGGYLDLDKLNSPAAAKSRGDWNTKGLPLIADDVPVLSSCNLGIHRSLFDELGGFDSRVFRSEDAELSVRLHQAGAQAVYAPDVVVHYRMRNTVWQTFVQAFRWGLNEPEIIAAIDPFSKQLDARSIARSWAWLVRSIPQLRHRDGRFRYAYVFGWRLGFARGRLAMGRRQRG